MAVAICGLNFALRYPGNENYDPYKSWGGFAWVVDWGFVLTEHAGVGK